MGGFGKETVDSDKIKDALKETFRPEFLNRVDEIVIFHTLSSDDLLQIVNLMLNDTINILKEKNITLEVSDEAKQFILEKGSDFKYGARPLRRAIQKYIEDEIAEKILLNEFTNGDTIKVSRNNDCLIYEK